MARHYKPEVPFNVPMKLLTPTTVKVKGVNKKAFPNPDDAPLIFGSFRTFGGTESTVNGVFTVIDTATVETWFRPDIKPNCRIYLCESGDTFEVVGTPENIEMRNQYLKFRVQRVGGEA